MPKKSTRTTHLAGDDAATTELFFGSHHRYFSKAWREAYGATLTHAEVKLIQGFRGLDPELQALLCEVMKELVIATMGCANGGPKPSIIVALRRGLRTIGKDSATHDVDNLRAWIRSADIASRSGMPVQIPAGVR